MRTIAQISDLHFGRIDPPVAEALVATLAARPPSLLVISGDLTQRARAWQYRAAAAYLRRLPVPQLIVPGNHDVPLYNVIRRFWFPFRRFRRFIHPDLLPLWRDEEMMVLGVNTARSFTRQSGWVTAEQIREVHRTLASAPAGCFKVLVTHHPFIPSPRDPEGDILLRADDALSRLEPSEVDLLLAGHLHFSYHDDVRSFHHAAARSVLAIQAGTATSTRRRGEPNAFNWITIDRGTVAVEVHSWTGAQFSPLPPVCYRRIQGVWQSDNRGVVEGIKPAASAAGPRSAQPRCASD
jgi:3',5'-cyclic AMP phosphodiesterase CpdA